MTSWNRRDWLKLGALGAAGALAPSSTRGADEALPIRGAADSCVMIWLGGGAAQIDTFDPKRKSESRQQPGSYYNAIPTAIAGETVCEHLPRIADRLDRCVPLRTVHHGVIDEHAAATNIMHTGRPVSGTVTYPSIGSIAAHELGPGGDGVPPYIVMGYPNVTRGPGFLGAKAGYVYLLDTESGPAGLTPPKDVTKARRSRRFELLAALRSDFKAAHPDDPAVQDYISASEAAQRLTGPAFQSAFQLDREPSSRVEAYGGEFGRRCLLARRLIERGVRFIEVSHNLNFVNGTGWDTHNEGQLNQHVLIKELDQALSSLIDDLERLGRLDRTLIVVSTEFGRPPEFDGGGGRGHQSSTFSCLLAGGGLRTGQVVGVTDELAKTIEADPITVPDFHATIHRALGIDPSHELKTPDGRPVPITDGGRPIARLFS